MVAETQPSEGRPARRVFRTTPLGMEVLREEIQRRLTSPRPHRADMQLALAHGIVLPQTIFLEALRVQRRRLAQRLEEVTAKWHIDRQNPDFPAHVDDLFDYSHHILEAELAWLDAFLNLFDEYSILYDSDQAFQGAPHA